MEKLQYDLFYIKNMSIALDLFIIVRDRSRRSCCGAARDARAAIGAVASSTR